MFKQLVALLLAVGTLAACGGTVSASSALPSTPASPASSPASDSSSRQAAIVNGADPARTDAAGIEWLCQPSLADNPCRSNDTATVVPRTGPTTVQKATAAANPPIDCFFIIPTVSRQRGLSANLQIQKSETTTVELEASRFSADCDVYAPVYPEVTLAGLRQTGKASVQAAEKQAYQVVQAAWQDYLAHYNHGRGVVIIGHSQGSAMAEELLRTQVDPSPQARQHLVSAIIPGGNVVVPAGKQVGGTFQHLSACTTPTQLHCVVAYSSFNAAPPPTAYFSIPGQGVSLLVPTPNPTKGMQVMCVNPAALVPGDGMAEPYLPSSAGNAAIKADKSLSSVPIPWQTTPDLYSAACTQHGDASWLQITAPITPGDTRTVVTPPEGANAGLHRFDITLFLGNLVTLVQQQTRSYQSTGR
jgi:DUF3089 family protein